MSISLHSSGEELFFPRGNPTLHPDSGGIHFDHRDVMNEFPIDSDSSVDWHLSFPAQEAFDTGDLGTNTGGSHPFCSKKK